MGNSLYKKQQTLTLAELHQHIGGKLGIGINELYEIKKELFINGYIIDEYIGCGGEGIVFTAKDNGQLIAVKCILVKDENKIKQEVDIMLKIQNNKFIHQFIKGFYSTSPQIEKKFFFFITEKLQCDLKFIIKNSKSGQQVLPYNQIVAFAIQMVEALKVLKNNNIFHFDVKPANILYDQKNKCFKLSDYGVAKVKESLEQSFTRTRDGGTFEYLPTESLLPLKCEQLREHSDRSDVFSLGIILIELLNGTFISGEEASQLRRDEQGNIVLKYLSNKIQNQNLNEIIKEMLITKRKERITLEDLQLKLQQLINEETSQLQNYLKNKVDNFTVQQIEKQFSISFTQILINHIENSAIKILEGNGLKQKQTKRTQQLKQCNKMLKTPFSHVNQINILIPTNNKQQHNHLDIKELKQLKIQKDIMTFMQFTLVEDELNKYSNAKNVNLDFRLKFYGSQNNLDPQYIASKFSYSLVKAFSIIQKLMLRFDNLQLGFQGISKIFFSIGCLNQNLSTLDLIFNKLQIGKQGALSLSIAIEKCSKNLRELGLYFQAGCQIDQEEINQICLSLKKCQKLKRFLLSLISSGKIGSLGIFQLSRSIPKNLSELYLDFVNQSITNIGIIGLCQFFEISLNLKSLKIILVDQTINQEKYIQKLGASLIKLPNLNSLSININKTLTIIKDLPFCSKLTSLSISFYESNLNSQTLQLKDKQVWNLTYLSLKLKQITLNEAIILLNKLEQRSLITFKLVFIECSLTWNQYDAYRFGKNLAKFKNLTTLHLLFLNKNTVGFISSLLIEFISKLQNITTLRLGTYNEFQYKIASFEAELIGKSLEKCHYLNTLSLYLWGNEIKQNGALSISKSLQICNNLNSLYLSIIEDETHKMEQVLSVIKNNLEKCSNLQKLFVEIKSTSKENNIKYLTKVEMLDLDF